MEELAYVTLRVFQIPGGGLTIKAETDISDTDTVVNILQKATTLLSKSEPDEVRTEEAVVEVYKS